MCVCAWVCKREKQRGTQGQACEGHWSDSRTCDGLFVCVLRRVWCGVGAFFNVIGFPMWVLGHLGIWKLPTYEHGNFNFTCRKSPGFQPILYKFIVWAFLGLSLYLCRARKPNYDLTICAVCGKSSVLVSLTLNVPRWSSEISTIGKWDHFGRGTCYAEDCSIGNNIGGF